VKRDLALLNVLLCIHIACQSENLKSRKQAKMLEGASLVILGNVQDAGSPHIACKKECCRELFIKPDPSRKVVSLGLLDPENNHSYLFEATPDISEQLKILKEYT